MTKNQNRTQNPRLSIHMSNTREKSEKNQVWTSSFPEIRDEDFQKSFGKFSENAQDRLMESSSIKIL